MGHTNATIAQKDAVATMIQKMKKPAVPPQGMSFTLGWDVVASYSEEQINTLLANRHAKDQSGMLNKLSMDVDSYNPLTDDTYIAHYELKFGPPLLQFDARATGEPMCSIRMELLSGTEKLADNPTRDMKPGWIIQLNNIPLASARGEMSEGGEIKGNPDVVPGDKAVQFDYSKLDQQHVVLGFHINKEKLVVEAIPPANMDPKALRTGYLKGDFQ